MVQAQQGHEVGGKLSGEFGIAVGAVGNEVDQLAETDQALGVGGAGSLHEELQESLVLAVLVVEVIFVRSGGVSVNGVVLKWFGNLRWVSADLVLQVRQVCIDLLERSNLALDHLVLELTMPSSRTVVVSLLRMLRDFF